MVIIKRDFALSRNVVPGGSDDLAVERLARLDRRGFPAERTSAFLCAFREFLLLPYGALDGEVSPLRAAVVDRAVTTGRGRAPSSQSPNGEFSFLRLFPFAVLLARPRSRRGRLSRAQTPLETPYRSDQNTDTGFLSRTNNRTMYCILDIYFLPIMVGFVVLYVCLDTKRLVVFMHMSFWST